MVRFILGLLLIAIAAFIALSFTPWWSIAVLAFLIGILLGAKWWQSLIYGCLGVGGVWLYQTYSIDLANEGILSAPMAELLGMKGGMNMIAITAALGALLGGLGALSGSLIRHGFSPKKKKRRSRNIAYKKRKKRRWSY